MMKFRMILVFGFLFAASLWAEPPKPSNIPKEAKYDEKNNGFVLQKIDGSIRTEREWNNLGVIERESYSIDDLYDFTIYLNGRWYSREQYYGFNIDKAKSLPPREKPSSIPEKAEFNFDFRKWELGETKEGKKEGVWKLWWPTGEAGGSVEYKNGIYDGKLNVIWENGKAQETCSYISGKQEGEYILYHESGKIHWIVKYVHGLKEGESFQYYESGETKYRTQYAKGNATMQETYENGKLKERKTFKNKK